MDDMKRWRRFQTVMRGEKVFPVWQAVSPLVFLVIVCLWALLK